MSKGFLSGAVVLVWLTSLMAFAEPGSLQNLTQVFKRTEAPLPDLTVIPPSQPPAFEPRDEDSPVQMEIQDRFTKPGPVLERLVEGLEDRKESFRRAVTCSELYQFYGDLPARLSPALTYKFEFLDLAGGGSAVKKVDMFQCYKFQASMGDPNFALMHALMSGCFNPAEAEQKYAVSPSCNNPFQNPAWSVASPINSKAALDAFNDHIANKIQRVEEIVNHSGEPLVANKYGELKIWNLDLTRFAAVCLMSEEGVKMTSWAKSTQQLRDDCRATSEQYR